MVQIILLQVVASLNFLQLVEDVIVPVTGQLCHITSLFPRASLLSSACNYCIVGMPLTGRAHEAVKLIQYCSNKSTRARVFFIFLLLASAEIVSYGGSASQLGAASERGGMFKLIEASNSYAAFTFMAPWSS